ncbi:hypothetical protein CHR56_08900 [Rhizobium leguminosarum bv. viciae]|nr:hypothetical protein CHR56_08900 [Rhizobium leguminosarum bv. viciae]
MRPHAWFIVRLDASTKEARRGGFQRAMTAASALFIVLYRTSKAWPGTSRLVVELRFHRDGI